MRRDHAAFDREQRAASRRQAQEAARSARELDRFATRTSHYGARYFAPHLPIASMAHRAASGIMHGFGVDPSFSGALDRNIELETQAVRISNQANLAGQQVSPEEIEAEVRRVSSKYGISRKSAVEAVQHFTDTGGDTKMGLQVLEKLANRSIVTSTDIDHLGQVAADASMHMGDLPDKLNKLFGTIDNFGVQSDRGAIAMRQVARQSPKLLSAATLFGGDVEHNQALMGTLVQIARKGGGWSPQSAASGVVSFVNTLQKGARIKAFDAAGIGLYNKDNTLRNPIDIIKDVLTHTNADPRKMNAFVMDAQAKRVTNYFAHLFREAGGGQAGLAAIDKEVGRFMNNTKITPEEEQAAIAKRQKTTAFQVQQFQNAMDDVANQVRVELLPVLQEAQPYVLEFVKGLGELAAWVVKNPFEAVIAALVLAIARAGIESAIRAAFEAAIKKGAEGLAGMLGGGEGGGRRVMAGGLVAAAGAGLALGLPIAAAIYGKGVSDINAADKATTNTGHLQADIQTAAADAKHVTPQQRAAFRRRLLDEEEALKKSHADLNDSSFLNYIFNPGGMQAKNEAFASRLGMVGEARKALGELEATPYEAPKGEGGGFQRVKGKPGESIGQLRERLFSENEAKKEQARQNELQQKMVGGIDRLAQAATGGGLNVNVQNFPNEPGDNPEAPAPG